MRSSCPSKCSPKSDLVRTSLKGSFHTQSDPGHHNFFLPWSLWQAVWWSPRHVHILISRTYEYISLHGKKDLADLVESVTLAQDCSGGPNVITRVLVKGRQEGQKRRQKDGQEPPEETQPCRHLDFSPVRSILDFCCIELSNNNFVLF